MLVLEWLVTLSVSMMLPFIGLGVVVTLAVLRRWRLAAVVVAAGLCFTAFAYAPYMYKPFAKPENTLRLVFLNVRIVDADIGKQAIALKAQTPDIIALVEVRKDWLTLREQGVFADYPYHALHKFGWRAGRIVYDDHALLLSRWPLTLLGGETGEGDGLALYRVDAPKPFHVLVVHPMAPMNPHMDTVRRNYLAMLARLMLPSDTVIVGDFNAVPWDPAMWPLWQRDDLVKHMNWLPTYHSKLPAIGIDHVVTGTGIDVATLRRWSDWQSDHFGLVLDFKIKDGF